MKKIVMACFWNQESNCGDKSYIEVFRALIRRYSSEATVDLCDFYARREFVAPKSEKSSKPTLKKRIASLLPHWVYKWIHNRNKYRRIRKYYEMKLKDADALVVPGGGLVEYSSWRDYYYLMQMLEKICTARNIPVFINSVGYVENEDPMEWIERWGGILNNPCVKHFTCRDNLPFFLKLKEDAVQVPCSACLAGDVLGIQKLNDGNTVGIGLMRYDCYSDYGNKVDKAFVVNYYVDLIVELRRLGYDVALFSVGVMRDHIMGDELLRCMQDRHIPTNGIVQLPRPTEVKTLLEQISGFKGIITVRTHSAYAAFSLNVPAVMIYFGSRGWAGKSNEFMTMMGRPENAICCDNVAPVELVERFQQAMEKGWDQTVRKEKKQLCWENFVTIMNKIGVLQSPTSDLCAEMFTRT